MKKLMLILTLSFVYLTAADVITFTDKNTIKNYGKHVYITPYPEEKCGNYGEYEYIENLNSYFSLNFKESKEFKLEKDCTYKIVKIHKKNSYQELIFKNKHENDELIEIFGKYIKNGTKIDETINLNNVEVLKEKLNNKEIILEKDQYVSLINLNTQTYYIYHFNYLENSFSFIGKTLISSGNKIRGKKYFETPETIIDRTVFKNGDWLAEGTDGKGFGEKGDRIFWLGIQKGIHLAMHTTTPWGVENLGKKYSKGCIRISPIFNKILRETEIIDGIFGKYIVLDSF